MNLLDSDHTAARAWLAAAEAGEFAADAKRVQGGPPTYSTAGWNAGPAFVDWNRTRRAPSPFDLVEAWRQLTFGCSVLNANAVARQTLRLFVKTGQGQHRPKSYLRGRPIDRKGMAYLRGTPEYAQQLKGADEIDEVMEHPLLTLLGEVNPDWDHGRLVRYTSLCLDIVGRAHWLPGDEQGEPTAGRILPPYLWPLLAQYVIPNRATEGSLVSHYYYFGREFEPTQLVNFRADSLRDPYALGQSPTQAAFAFVGLTDSYTALMENLMTQSVRPSVILTNKNPDEPLGDKERLRLQREINYQLSAGSVGKAWVMDGALDIKSLNVPPTSLAENEISETAIKYVSFIFGVPLSFLRNEDSNRAVAEAGHYQHAKLGVEPRCVNIASTLTKWTHAEGRRRGQDWSRLMWVFDNPVKEDEQREADIWAKDIANGSRTINERRLHLGYDRVDWGDEPWLPTTLTQPSTAEEQRKQQQATADRQFQAEWGGDKEQGDEAEGKALDLLRKALADDGLDTLEIDTDDLHAIEVKRNPPRKPKPKKPGKPATPHAGNAPHTPPHFEPGKHPHGSDGRFIETPDAPKPGEATKPSGGKTPAKPKTTKKPTQYDALHSARLVGKGDDARVVMHDGSPGPAHIKPTMIAPAWTDVRINPDPNGKVLVMGRDAKGKMKSVYSKEHEMQQEAAKLARIDEMSGKRHEIHDQNQKNLASHDPKVRENAAVTYLIERQGTRPGSESDTKGYKHLYDAKFSAANIHGAVERNAKSGKETSKVKIVLEHGGKTHEIPVKDVGTAKQLLERKASGKGLEDARYWLQSHGATTLEGRHVIPTKEGVRLQFVGKEGVWHDHLIGDPQLGKMLVARKEAAGETGQIFKTNEKHLNAYIHTLDGGGFSAKDFRTLKATTMAHELVRSRAKPATQKEREKAIMEVATKVSRVLGNQPKMALENYINPNAFAAWR